MAPHALAVLFRVAGGPEVGFGHLRRSWTLASRLEKHGATVRFVTASPEPGRALTDAGFVVSVEPGADRVDESVRVLRRTDAPVLCVVDDPDLPSDRLPELAGCAPVACLDDTGERFFPIQTVVNGSAGAEDLAYRGAPRTRYLLGPQYILLRDSFAEEPDRPAPSPVAHRVLVLTGGGDTGSVSEKVVRVVEESLPGAQIDVVCGPFGTPPRLEGFRQQQVTVHRSPDDLRNLMLRTNIAVSGGGQTAYELAATATPTLGMRLAQNQSLNLRGLSRAGALLDIGAPQDPGFSRRLADALTELARDPERRAAMGLAGRRLVDGLGAERVAAYLMESGSRTGAPDRVGSCGT